MEETGVARGCGRKLWSERKDADGGVVAESPLKAILQRRIRLVFNMRGNFYLYLSNFLFREEKYKDQINILLQRLKVLSTFKNFKFSRSLRCFCEFYPHKKIADAIKKCTNRTNLQTTKKEKKCYLGNLICHTFFRKSC